MNGELIGRLQAASSVWELASELLEEWAAQRPAEPACLQGHGDRWDAWAHAKDQTWDLAERWTASHVSREQLDPVLAIVQAAWPQIGADALHAAATGIDEGAHALFADTWRRGVDVLELSAGQLYYVGDPAPETYIASELAQSTRPTSATEPLLGELPHIRRYQPSWISITIDGRWRTELEAIARDNRVLAAAHPNTELTEFEQTRIGEAVFPVIVPDDALQRQRFQQLLDDAIDPTVNARVVVFPELSASPALVEQVRARLVQAPGQRLVVAGSFHTKQHGDGLNRAVGVLARSDARLQHDKLVAFFGPGGVKEGIQRGATLTLYDAGEFRVGIAICKDILDDNVRALYARHGVNLLLVPALSVKTRDFATAAAALVKSNQTVTLMANGVLKHDGAAVEPAALLGQPFAGCEVLPHHPGAPAPHLSIFSTGEPAPIPW